ncbi:alpha/beta hydrolase [Arthrobacter sp. ISL-65]|uniref:alpha/beta hydrolase n=1 Tax=Arthrobacter sp. ISL-65 TaxID=2819112 RepID=UPI001BEA5CF3|nr:alpha/beta hydrolase [Arthrobacter sp. ISL-65]MBT2550736.1 alpha/beta hydrolase [Arthrobacter sp. ISL-65]
MEWQSDILGPGFESCAFEAAGGDGVRRRATLVRFTPPDAPDVRIAGPRRAVLFLHGWSDYFFNIELARFWDAHGFEFFALDMHNHGRSLQPGTHGGYVADLGHYDAEIGTAAGMIAESGGAGPLQLALMGHSTGGLVAALWASRNAGSVSHLVLNSPWLEMHGSALVRRAAWTMVEPIARLRPEAVLRLPERGFYWRSISSSAEGEWTLDAAYRPPLAFPVRAAWLSAILAGQAKVARGLGIEVPILVLLSAASENGMVWNEEMRRTDAVLDVNTIAARAVSLGSSVTVERVDGALHDVFLSRADVRADAYRRLAKWIRGYAA